MMKRQLLFILCCIPLWNMAQTISPAGAFAGGGFLPASNGSLSYTIGQSFQETMTSGGKVMTQGIQQPEINIKMISVPSTFCNGDTVLIPYQALGFIDDGNSFELRMSDAAGSFASPTTLASNSGTASGSFNAVIPFNITPSSNYRLQIKTTSSTHNSPVKGPLAVDVCSLRVNLRMLIEGLYIGSGTMTNPLYLNGISSDPSDADLIQIELHESFAPYTSVSSLTTVLKTDGNAIALFPGAVYGGSYYVVVKHRNSIETWSKFPVVFSTPELFVNFIN
jgi:hypothetical protein